MTVWEVFGHIGITLVFLGGVGVGLGIWSWQLDEEFPMPVRIFGVVLAIACVVLAAFSWTWG